MPKLIGVKPQSLLEGAASPRRSAAVRYILCEIGNRRVLVNNAGIGKGAIRAAAARQRISQSGLRNITLLQADAQMHAFEPNRFDLIASRFGVMFFADPVAAFRNLLGAMRPGGRLSFACWAALEENRHWLIPYEVALRHLGPPAPKPPHAPGPMALAEPEYVRSVLERAGYEGIEIRREAPDMIGASPEEEAEHAYIMGPSGRLIEEKKPPESVRELIKQEMTEALAAHAKGGEMVLPSTIFLVTARRANAAVL